jgi:hypothetical protein
MAPRGSIWTMNHGRDAVDRPGVRRAGTDQRHDALVLEQMGVVAAQLPF